MSAELHFLVIGYGNTLRRDDGAGIRVAEAVAELDLPGVRVITRHQLVPELAEPIASARAVVFVDAGTDATGLMELRPLAPATNPILNHAIAPPSLLALSRQIFNHCPPAWAIAIPVEDLGYGDGLSHRARIGIHAALAQIRRLAGLKTGPAQQI